MKHPQSKEVTNMRKQFWKRLLCLLLSAVFFTNLCFYVHAEKTEVEDSAKDETQIEAAEVFSPPEKGDAETDDSGSFPVFDPIDENLVSPLAVPTTATYRLRNRKSGLYLTYTGSNVVQSTYTGAANQTWMVTKEGIFCTLRPTNMGGTNYLDVDGSYSTNPSSNTYLSNGTNVSVFNNGSTHYHSSRWLILESQKGSFKLQTKMSYVQDGSYYPTSYYKYLSASGTGNGANVYQYSYNALGDGYSDWYFEPVSLHPQSGGYYCIRNKNSGKYLTHVPSNNTVIQSEGTGRGEQTWHLVRYSDGFWTLRPITATSTYFLDVNGSYSTTPSQNTYLSNYTPVTVFNNGSTAYNSSRWKIAQGYDGSYTILAKMSYVQNGAYYDPSYHKFLSLSSSTSNQNIFQFSHTGGDEEWYFDFVSGSTKVYQSQKYPGLEVDGSLARDMGYNDKTRSQIIAVSEKLTTMLDVFDNYGPTEVYNTMMGLATTFTKNDASMTPVATDMFNHFWNGSGADYRNPVLTQKAVGHPTTQTYINGSKALILQSIRSHNGDITKVPFDIAVQSGHEYLDRPQFTTEADLYNGLKICINDTWGRYIEIKNYSFDGSAFSGTLKYTFYDHFGLDDEDIPYYMDWEIPFVSNRFAAWYILQHYKGQNGASKPFVTYFEAEVPFSGTL